MAWHVSGGWELGRVGYGYGMFMVWCGVVGCGVCMSEVGGVK